MFKIALKVTFFLILASFIIDILGCNRFNKTQTYKYFKELKGNKYGKVFLKRLQKAKKRYLKSTLCIWDLTSAPMTCGGSENRIEPFLGGWVVNLKSRVFVLLQHVVTFVSNTISGFQYPDSQPFEDLKKIGRALANVMRQRLMKFLKSAHEFLDKQCND